MSTGLRQPISRRGFLTVGTIGLGGLTLADLLRIQARADLKNYAPIAAKADSVIHIFLPGGIAHQETFDPKPFAPIEYRGEMGSIPTKIDGERFSETLPQTAQIADKLTVIRSMTHGEAAHERGTHNMFTGYRPSPALQYPSIGSVISHEYGPKNNLPPYVCVPTLPNVYAGTGYLSSSFSPFSLGSDPADAGFRVQDLNLPGGINESRFATRRNVLDAVNAHFAKKEKSDNIAAMDTFYQRAYSLISSQKAREAFNIAAEPAKIRDEYGRNAAGQRMLMARRLVAAGVRMVTAPLRRLGLAHPDRRRHEEPDARLRPGVRRLDPRPRPHRPARPDDRHGLQRVRPDAQDQQGRRPRPLAQGLQRRPGRRRHQEGLHPRRSPTPPPASPSATRSAPRTSPPPSTTRWASSPTRS